MLNPNEQTTTTPEQTVESTINNEAVITYLKRLGVTDDELSSESFNESVIASKVFTNEVLSEQYNKTIKTNQDNFLTGKLKKIMSELTGLTEDEVKEDTDFRKIVTKGFDKVKNSTNTDVDTLSMEFRTKELQYLSQLEQMQSQIDEEKSKVSRELKDYKVNMKVDSFIQSANLTQNAKANQKDITEMALYGVQKEYDIREKNGLLVLWTKGGQPVYKANSSQPMLLEDALETHLDKFGFLKKQEEVKTLTSETNNHLSNHANSETWSRKGYIASRR